MVTSANFDGSVSVPPEARPLSDILLDVSDPLAPCIYTAIQSLETFRDGFLSTYDSNLHAELHTMLVDALLIFRTAEAMLRLKQRYRAASPHAAVAGPIDLDPTVTDTMDDAATASTPVPGDTGGDLEYYCELRNVTEMRWGLGCDGRPAPRVPSGVLNGGPLSRRGIEDGFV